MTVFEVLKEKLTVEDLFNNENECGFALGCDKCPFGKHCETLPEVSIKKQDIVRVMNEKHWSGEEIKRSNCALCDKAKKNKTVLTFFINEEKKKAPLCNSCAIKAFSELINIPENKIK